MKLLRELMNIEVDGIPLGLGYGIRFEPAPFPEVHINLDERVFSPAQYPKRWLTRIQGDDWEDVREIPGDANVEVKVGDRILFSPGVSRDL